LNGSELIAWGRFSDCSIGRSFKNFTRIEAGRQFGKEAAGSFIEKEVSLNNLSTR